jgi:hypothetical protein
MTCFHASIIVKFLAVLELTIGGKLGCLGNLMYSGGIGSSLTLPQSPIKGENEVGLKLRSIIDPAIPASEDTFLSHAKPSRLFE